MMETWRLFSPVMFIGTSNEWRRVIDDAQFVMQQCDAFWCVQIIASDTKTRENWWQILDDDAGGEMDPIYFVFFFLTRTFFMDEEKIETCKFLSIPVKKTGTWWWCSIVEWKIYRQTFIDLWPKFLSNSFIFCNNHPNRIQFQVPLLSTLLSCSG